MCVFSKFSREREIWTVDINVCNGIKINVPVIFEMNQSIQQVLLDTNLLIQTSWRDHQKKWWILCVLDQDHE